MVQAITNEAKALPKLSDKGAQFICNFESFRSLPYNDTGGLPTIGFGQRITPAQVVKWTHGISREDALVLFKEYIAGLEKELSRYPLAGFFPHQNDAIISLAYNIGVEAFQKSTIYSRLITRSVELSPWLEFIFDQKKHRDEGLVHRREAELKLFIYGLYI